MCPGCWQPGSWNQYGIDYKIGWTTWRRARRQLMKTIILQQPYQFERCDTPEPGAPEPGEALVRVRRIGICGTDLHGYRGRQPFFTYPRIVGHELGVEVVAVNPPPASAGCPAIQLGDRCAVEPYLNCGGCIACRRGRTNCCTDLKVLGVHVDGGMREFIRVPIDKLHPSNRLSFDQLALVETLGIGAHAVSRGAPDPGEWVLIAGAGPIGLAVLTFARLAGARIILFDTSAQRLAFAGRHFPVDAAISAAGDVPAQLRDITGGDLPTLVFDATGNPQSMTAGFEFVAHSGRLVFVGLFQGDVTFNDPNFHRREMTLLATRNAVGADLRRIVGLMEAGRIDTAPWITHRATFDTLIDRFPAWLEPGSGVIKAVVDV